MGTGHLPESIQNGPDTLTGSSIDMAATYGPVIGSLEINCLLDLVSPDYSWADGITLTFPVGTTIIEALPFEAGGGTVYPEIVGNTVNMGIVNGSQTGYGIFHGGEEWTVSVMPYQLPYTVDWIIYDDGYSGGVLNAEGSTAINAVGYATKIEDHWNVLNLTTQDTVLEDQTVIMGYDLYTGEYVGDPIVEGFKISADVSYDDPIGFADLELFSPSGLTILTSNSSTNTLDIQNYTIFGGVLSSKAIDNFGDWN